MKLFDTKEERIEKSMRQNKEEIEYHKQKILAIELDILNGERKLRAL